MSPGFQNDGPMLHMNPHLHRCCQHNWGHGWPYLAEHLYFATPDNGLAVVFFSESQVTAKVGSGTEIRVEQQTHYPFDDQIRLVIHTSEPSSFPLYLRVPGWCELPGVEINGQTEIVRGERQDYLLLDRNRGGRRRRAVDVADANPAPPLGEEPSQRVRRSRSADVLAENRRAIRAIRRHAKPGRPGKSCPRRPGITAWSWREESQTRWTS